MLKNYLKIAIRNLLRFKAYSIVNLLGLSIGLTIGVLILLFVTDELSYDGFHAKSDRIFKVVTLDTQEGIMETNDWPVGYKLKTGYPGVESVLYTRRASPSMMVYFEKKRYEHDVFYASEDFFKLFSFQLMEGNPSTALAEPFSLVITNEMKKRYFGPGPALGKSLTLRDSLEFVITGVAADLPVQSHIQFDMLASFTTYEELNPGFTYTGSWGNFSMRNYILLAEEADAGDLRKNIRGLYERNIGDWLKEMGVSFHLDLIPLPQVYLYPGLTNGFGPKGSLDRVYLVAAIAIFVILLACINFVNLTTARSVYRAREVGLRKTVGSTRSALFWQFLGEALVLTLLAFCSVAVLIDLVLPYFNHLMGKSYELSSLFNVKVMAGIIILVLTVAGMAGFYPALVLSGFKPVEVLKGRMQSGTRGGRLRRVLVVFQFLVSAGLVLATLLVLNQLDYMRSKNLGFQKEQVLVLDVTRVPKSASHGSFKNSLLSFAGVKDVSFTNALPGRPGWQGQWAYPGSIEEGQHVDTEYMAIDENYIDVLGLELIAGHNFDLNNKAELEEGLIINETTVNQMGWYTAENALGKEIVSPSRRPEGKVIGVVKDYHGMGLQEDIWPMAMDYSSYEYGQYYAVRVESGQIPTLVEKVKKSWQAHLGDYTYEYFFLDDDFEQQYQSEEKLMQVFTLFSSLTLVIAGIGLLGLVSFLVLSRRREISIRKVLGASLLSVTGLLSKEFVLLVLLANAITAPIAWYLGNQWLNSFAFHMDINPVIFLITLVVTLVMAVLTVGVQTLKAGLANPAEALRSE